MNSCKFDIAWRGRCGTACQGQVCEQHEKVKCCVCGAQATTNAATPDSLFAVPRCATTARGSLTHQSLPVDGGS